MLIMGIVYIEESRDYWDLIFLISCFFIGYSFGLYLF